MKIGEARRDGSSWPHSYKEKLRKTNAHDTRELQKKESCVNNPRVFPYLSLFSCELEISTVMWERK